jgi:amidohydrolase
MRPPEAGPGIAPGLNSDYQSMDLTELAIAWQQALSAELPAAIALRHELHAHPEVSGAESATAARVAAAIGRRLEPAAGTGGLIRIGPASGPAIGVRAELDALPVIEQTGAAFAARNGVMHACGHDVHLAALVALIRAGSRLADAVGLPAGLLAVLQPREETAPSGAADVVSSGLLAAHDVRAMIGAHLQPQTAAGQVAIDPGPVNAAIDEFHITVTGRGGHGAYPHLAIDPVPALCRCVLAAQDVLRSVVSPMHPAVISVTQIQGAAAPNVIPDVASAAGTLRTMWPADKQAVQRRMSETVQGIAAAHGCTGRITFTLADPALANDSRLAARGRHWFGVLGGELAEPFASCGSDDFAWYAEAAPLLMMFVGTGSEDGANSLHDPHFLPSDERIGQVARALLAGCLAGFEHGGLPGN